MPLHWDICLPSLPSDTLLLVAPREIEFIAWSLWFKDRESQAVPSPWDYGVRGGGDKFEFAFSCCPGVGYRAGAVRSSLTGRALTQV